MLCLRRVSGWRERKARAITMRVRDIGCPVSHAYTLDEGGGRTYSLGLHPRARHASVQSLDEMDPVESGS